MPGTKMAMGAVQVSAPMPTTLGTYLFVDSNNGSDGNTGLKPEKPLATVAKGIVYATAAKMDTIIVLPGHAEAVAAANLNVSKSMVRIVGLGVGASRPTFTYGAAAATITISAAGVQWDNCHFIANFLNVATAFTLTTAKDFTLSNSSFLDNSSVLNFLCVVTSSATNNANDGLKVLGNYCFGLATTDGAFISILGNQTRMEWSDNFLDKAATNDAGHFFTLGSKVVLGLKCFRNTLNVVGATSSAVAVFGTGSSTTNTGLLAYNLTTSLDTTAALFITAALNLAVHENYMSGVVAASGTLFPAADNPA